MIEFKTRDKDSGVHISNGSRVDVRIIQNVILRSKYTVRAQADNSEEKQCYEADMVAEAAEDIPYFAEKTAVSLRKVSFSGSEKTIKEDTAGIKETFATEKAKKDLKTRQFIREAGIKSRSQVISLDRYADLSSMPVQTNVGTDSTRAKATKEVAKHSMILARKTAETTGKVVTVINAAIMRAARAVISAAESLIAAFVAGGGVAVAAVVIVCLTGLLIASPLGIFLSGEAGAGKTIQMVVQEINTEFYQKINDIKKSVSYDDLKITGRGASWPEVLAIYAVETSMDEEAGQEVATVTPEKESLFRSIFWEMNKISYSTEEYTETVTVEVENEDGTIDEEEQEEERLRLLISVRNKSAEDTEEYRSFSGKQRDMYAELMSDRFSSLWARMVGGYSLSLGFVPSDATWVGTGSFIWPLPINGTITSGYGYRADPFTGETKFHGGIDIAAAEGTPILAADDGVVEIPNGSDSWGGGYGFYVKIGHGNGYETLYGHCSSICVIAGQSVQKGEVIAYVGSTGNSTGNHLHFEIHIFGNKEDPLIFFA